jgi:hypothetical protein
MLQKMWMFSQKMQHHEMVRAARLPWREDRCSALSIICIRVCLPCTSTGERKRDQSVLSCRCGRLRTPSTTRREVAGVWSGPGKAVCAVCVTHTTARTCGSHIHAHLNTHTQPPPGTFGGTSGLGGADGFGGTGENNVMYAGGWPVSRVRAPACAPAHPRACPPAWWLFDGTVTAALCLSAAPAPAGEPKNKVDQMFGFALPCAGMECRRPNEKGAMPNARAARTQVLSHTPEP